MIIRLYQIPNDTMKDLADIGSDMPVSLFLGMREPTLIELLVMYECTWSGDIGTTDPEEVFDILNNNHPKDYNTRSMSCGDVLVTTHGVYLVSMIGFKKLALDIK
jgi:hypothetical protein